jgi:hypothetical protein
MAKSVTLSDSREVLLRSMRAMDLPELTEMGGLLKGMGEGISAESNNKIMTFIASIARVAMDGTDGGVPISAAEIGQLDLSDYMALLNAMGQVVDQATHTNPTTAPATRKRGSR